MGSLAPAFELPDLAVGAEALLALARTPAARSPNGAGHHKHRGNRDLADSKLNRDGLPRGARAPDFLLPAVDGRQLSLAQFRGRQVLLVFSDPHCGPCDQLMPALEQFHRRSGETQVLLVSRGDREANWVKAAEHGLTFPIGLQKQWEVSREYAKFATPMAYRVDQAGVIAADVATGVEPILALLASVRPSNGEAPARRTPCGARSSTGECDCGQRVAARRR